MLNKHAVQNVLHISFPVVCEMLVYTLTSVFSFMMIGNYGKGEAVTAVGLGNNIIYSCFDIFIMEGICVGITSVVSRSMGARKYKSVEEYASIGFTIGLIISFLICSSIYKFGKEILYFAGARGNILNKSYIFTKVTSISVFFYMITSVISSILRGIGNTYVPFIISSITSIIKLVFDCLLIFGYLFPKMGIVGAAISSVISQAIGFLFSLFYIIFKSKVKLKLKYILCFNLTKAKELINLSFPSSLEEAAYSVGKLLCNFIIIHAGNVAFASNQIATSIQSISIMIGFGFNVATTTLVGNRTGARNYKKSKQYTYNSAFCASFIMIIISIAFIIFPNTLVTLFIGKTEKDVISLASLCITISALAQPFIAISSVFSGALKGMGDTKSPLIISIFSSWGIGVFLTFLFIYIFKFSIIYVWFIDALQWLLEAFLMFVWFKKIYKCML